MCADDGGPSIVGVEAREIGRRPPTRLFVFPAAANRVFLPPLTWCEGARAGDLAATPNDAADAISRPGEDTPGEAQSDMFGRARKQLAAVPAVWQLLLLLPLLGSVCVFSRPRANAYAYDARRVSVIAARARGERDFQKDSCRFESAFLVLLFFAGNESREGAYQGQESLIRDAAPCRCHATSVGTRRSSWRTIFHFFCFVPATARTAAGDEKDWRRHAPAPLHTLYTDRRDAHRSPSTHRTSNAARPAHKEKKKKKNHPRLSRASPIASLSTAPSLRHPR